jgi:hypothetical protein|nr:hypothetical protein [uncultured Brevundimonas sp.]
MENDRIEAGGEPSAAEAFEALRGEVALMRLGVEVFAAERRAQPDYTETLGQLVADMATSSAAMGRLAERGALSLTPEDVAREIRIAQGHVRREASEVMQDAVRHLSDAVLELGRWIGQARTADLQNRRLLHVAVAAVLFGGVISLTPKTAV